ncbi:hypothetical protein BGZ49_007501 [Haplosporangium sp. Z 27]|nr:hypothetical protein BGZ49_007501 [Haplosporangium sp. Z 27]
MELSASEKKKSEKQVYHPDPITINSDTSDDDEFMMRKTEVNNNKGKGVASEKQEAIVENDDEGEASVQRVPTLNFKKRPRIIRTKFGDYSSESSNSAEEEMINQSKPASKRRVRNNRDEAEDVLRLRKDAAKNELELKKRIKEQETRAKLRGSMGPLHEDEILINPGHKKTERGVAIPAFLATQLKPHQIDGVRFMWKNVVMFDGGCILAHSMGLGKTFQVIAFVYVLLREIQAGNKDIPQKLQEGRVLLLMPPIVLDNWDNEFDKWIPKEERRVVKVRRLSHKAKTAASRIMIIDEWYKEGGVFLLGYPMFRDMCTGQVHSEVQDRYRQLLQEGPSLIIADEGHALKNTTAKVNFASKNLKSTARVILTGYPLQNRLEEYWCMVDFVRPNFLGDISTFRHNYIRPIGDGLYPDSSLIEKKVSSKKLKVLTELIKNFVMRKDQSVLRASLPKKVEFVISCKLSTLQYYLYTQFLPTLGLSPRDILGNGHVLLTICNHPAAFKSTLDLMTTRNEKQERTEKAKLVASGSSETTTTEVTPVAEVPPVVEVPPATAVAPKDDFLNPGEENDDEVAEKEIVEALRIEIKINTENTKSLLDVNDVSHGYKVKVLLDILTESRALSEKLAIPLSLALTLRPILKLLDFLEHIVIENGFRPLKLDGSTPIMDRQDMIDEFNQTQEYDLFLITSGSGSQGINLVSASRVVIFDVGWNPSHDEQAIARAFRYGQKRKVFVYRLQTYGTWEEKLYKTNIHKLGLSTRVVDKKNMIKTSTKIQMKSYFEEPPAISPVWASDENVEALFAKPDTEDQVLRKIIENNRKEISLVVPQSELIREEDSDLTEADMIEIQSMIDAEQRRIEGKPNPPPITQAQYQAQYPVQSRPQTQYLPQTQYQPQPQFPPYQPQTQSNTVSAGQQMQQQYQYQYKSPYLPGTSDQSLPTHSNQLAHLIQTAHELNRQLPNKDMVTNQTPLDAANLLADIRNYYKEKASPYGNHHWELQGESRAEVLEKSQLDSLASARARLMMQQNLTRGGQSGVSSVQVSNGTGTTSVLPSTSAPHSAHIGSSAYTTTPSVSAAGVSGTVSTTPQVKPTQISMSTQPTTTVMPKPPTIAPNP